MVEKDEERAKELRFEGRKSKGKEEETANLGRKLCQR